MPQSGFTNAIVCDGCAHPVLEKAVQRVKMALPTQAMVKPYSIRFGSRLAPFTNAILQKRYGENTPVKGVLAWLQEQGASCSRETYQHFIRRLLFHLPDAQAAEMGVELPMLHAVRRRLKLPLNGRKPWRAPYKRGRPQP